MENPLAVASDTDLLVSQSRLDFDRIANSPQQLTDSSYGPCSIMLRIRHLQNRCHRAT